MINSTTEKRGAFLTSGRGLSLSLKSHSRSCQKHNFPPLPSQKHIYVFTVLCSYLLAQQKRVIKSMATPVKENTKYNIIPANSSQNNLNAFFNLCFSPFVLAGFGGGLVQQLILMLGSGNVSCTAGSALTWLPCAAQVAAYQTILAQKVDRISRPGCTL